LLDRLSRLEGVSMRKMFGEYALYHGGKVAALLCDGRLFVKPTAAGRALLGNPDEAPPYPKAKPHFAVDADMWEDEHALCALIAATSEALPMPKPKAKKKKAL